MCLPNVRRTAFMNLGLVLKAGVFAVSLSACSDGDDATVPTVTPLALSSPNLSNGGVFQSVNTCEGQDVSPALSWTGGPPNAFTYAVTLTDVTTGKAQWAVWDITGSVRSLPAVLSADPLLPNGPMTFSTSTPAKQSQAAGGFGYEGPCPRGALHMFRFGIDAIGSSPLPGVTQGSPPDAVAAAVAAASLEHAEITAVSAASPP